MIVPMKRVSLLVMDKDKKVALERLRELGVVHLERKTATSQTLTELTNRYAHVEAARVALFEFYVKKKSPPAIPVIEGDLADHVVPLADRRKKLQDSITGLYQEQLRVAEWGEFDPKEIAHLTNNNVNMSLYVLSQESYETNVGEIPVVILSKFIDKKITYYRLAAFDLIPDEKPWQAPELPLSVISETIELQRKEVVDIEAELSVLAPLMTQLESERDSVQVDIEFETVHASMELINEAKTNEGADLSVSWLSGYIPAPDVALLEQESGSFGWGFCTEDPAEDDRDVPTKLENGKFVSLLAPVMEFLDLAPGYRERDVSGIFLVFLTLFFAMIFGDAAYGAILLIISVFVIVKTAKTGTPVIIKFLLLMSGANLIWGVLTGSWFGFDISRAPQVLQNITLPLITNISYVPGWLETYNANNFWITSGIVAPYATIEALDAAVLTNFKLFCFLIALVHLCLGHILRLVSFIKSPKALGEIGHLAMIFAMFFVVTSMIVYNAGFGLVMPWHLYLLAGGFMLVFLFSNYETGMGQSVSASMTDIISLLLTITGAFADITSYIRLWAVALAGAAIAHTVNGLAEPLLASFILFIFGAVFFFCGHIFNIVLNAMAFLIHGIRLNTLEFSSHLGLEWAGIPYKPFSKRS